MAGRQIAHATFSIEPARWPSAGRMGPRPVKVLEMRSGRERGATFEGRPSGLYSAPSGDKERSLQSRPFQKAANHESPTELTAETPFHPRQVHPHEVRLLLNQFPSALIGVYLRPKLFHCSRSVAKHRKKIIRFVPCGFGRSLVLPSMQCR